MGCQGRVKNAPVVIADFSANVVYGPAREEDHSTFAVRTYPNVVRLRWPSPYRTYGTIVAQTLVKTGSGKPIIVG